MCRNSVYKFRTASAHPIPPSRWLILAAQSVRAQSPRKAIIGSMRVARMAGNVQASPATPVRTKIE